MVGAFKTPSLRNLAKRAPYGHDGRFSTLRAVLEHYNELSTEAGIGHREETLRPLKFSPQQLHHLETFLQALN
jgi:cytochrome c peroxidase